MISAVIVGCGNIATRYAADLARAGVVDLIGYYDVASDRAAALAAKHGGEAFEDLDQAIETAELVLNLTIFEAHYPVTKLSVERGRHVYSEKPLALRLGEALEIARLANSHEVRVAAAPFTFLGAAQATAIEWVRNARLGEVRLAYAEVNHGRIETWHPSPAPFYEVGPMLDVGVYPLAILIKAFGPVTKVRAIPSSIAPERTDLSGQTFTTGSPDYWLVDLEHGDGTKVRLTVNFYVYGDEGIVFHGDAGSLQLESWFVPNSSLVFTPYGGEPQAVSTPKAAPEVDWSVGVADFVSGIESGVESALNLKDSVHLVAVLEAITSSGNSEEPVVIEAPS
ncbi:MAG TPA: Gfo/Idh/MocA family oxidoreductase [Acidimicrobiia bacterium]|nr:Gfo/Idh/MocA family oxidoreductase [Acidimicrobiia bacterium]